MEELLFKELAWKCYQNGLGFEAHRVSTSLVVDIKEFEQDSNINRISEGRLEGWCLEYETAIDALKRMHQEVDDFIASKSIEETENETSNLTSYERHLKDAGHKEGDFN